MNKRSFTTVKDLIEKLKEFPEDALVFTNDLCGDLSELSTVDLSSLELVDGYVNDDGDFIEEEFFQDSVACEDINPDDYTKQKIVLLLTEVADTSDDEDNLDDEDASE